MENCADDTRDDVGIEDSNIERNDQTQNFDNAIIPRDPFLDTEYIGLRQSYRIIEMKDQHRSLSISAGAVCKGTKDIDLFAIQLSSFTSASLCDAS